jgi:hypothetical protein
MPTGLFFFIVMRCAEKSQRTANDSGCATATPSRGLRALLLAFEFVTGADRFAINIAI